MGEVPPCTPCNLNPKSCCTPCTLNIKPCCTPCTLNPKLCCALSLGQAGQSFRSAAAAGE